MAIDVFFAEYEVELPWLCFLLFQLARFRVAVEGYEAFTCDLTRVLGCYWQLDCRVDGRDLSLWAI